MEAGFKAVAPNVPTLDEITELYQEAMASNDERLMGAAEQAVNRLAAAEAAAAEAATFVDFARRVRT